MLCNTASNPSPPFVTQFQDVLLSMFLANEVLRYQKFQIYASERFMMYNEGVFVDNACNLAPNHAVLIVGFGFDPKTNRDYW